MSYRNFMLLTSFIFSVTITMKSPVNNLVEMKKELMPGSDVPTQEDLSSIDEIETFQKELLAQRELLHQSRMAMLMQVVQDTLAQEVAMDGFRK